MKYEKLALSTIDNSTLPDDLLNDQKEQMRVEFNRDDELVKSIIGRAIGEIENAADICVFNQTWIFTPGDKSILPDGRVRLPKRPMNAMVIKRGETVVTDQYTVSGWDSLTNPGALFVSGSSLTDIDIEITAGYATKASLPFAILSLIHLVAAGFYEYRESMTPGQVYELPDNLQRAISLWVPSV